MWPNFQATVAFDGVTPVDVTDYVVDFKSNGRGRTYGQANCDTATANITLDNSDGRFTPANSASPYYPNVKTGRPFKVTATYPASSVNLLPLDIATGVSPTGGVLSWTAGGGCVLDDGSEVSLGPALSGERNLKVYCGPANAGPATVVVGNSSSYATVTASTVYTLSAYVSAASACYLQIDWYTSAGAYISSSAAGTPGTSGRLSVTATAPATAARAIAAVRVSSSPASSLWQLDAFQLEAAGSATTYNLPVTVYPVYTGTIDAWPMTWPTGSPETSVVVAVANDGMKPTGRTDLPADPVRNEVSANQPLLWYPLDEAVAPSGKFEPNAGTVAAGASLIPTLCPHGSGDINFGADGPGTLGLHSTSFNATLTTGADVDKGQLFRIPKLGSAVAVTGIGSGFSISFWMKIDQNNYDVNTGSSGPYTGGTICQFYRDDSKSTNLLTLQAKSRGGGTKGPVDICWTILGAGVAQQQGSSSGWGSLTLGAPNVGDNAWHHFAFTFLRTGTQAWTLNSYMDGVNVLSSTPSGSAYANLGAGFIRGNIAGDEQSYFADVPTGPNYGWALRGSLAQFAVYGSVLTAADAANMAASKTAFYGEYDVNRIQRALTYTGVTTPVVSDSPAGVTQLTAQANSGKALQAAQDAAHAANGFFLFDAAGNPVYQSRLQRYSTGITWILDADQGTGVESDTGFVLDDTMVVNRAAYDNGNGSTALAQDLASQAVHGVVSDPDTTVGVLNPIELQDRAQQHVNVGADPGTRCDQVTLDPTTSDALWPIALNAQLGASVQFANLPTQAPTDATTFFIEKVALQVSAWGTGQGVAKCTLNLSPMSANDAGFTLDDPVLGVLDGNYGLVY